MIKFLVSVILIMRIARNIMKTKIKSLAAGFTLLIIIQFIANCLVKFLHIAFPAPLLGMVLLAVLLYFKIIPEKFIKDICDLLLKNMALFFIPLFVGIIAYGHLFKANIMPIMVTIIFTTFSTMLITAFLVELIIKHTQKEEHL